MNKQNILTKQTKQNKMKRKITFLIAVIMLLTIIALPETVLG